MSAKAGINISSIDVPILWSYPREIRERADEILETPDDNLFPLAAAQYLATTRNIIAAVQKIGIPVVVQNWPRIRERMKSEYGARLDPARMRLLTEVVRKSTQKKSTSKRKVNARTRAASKPPRGPEAVVLGESVRRARVARGFTMRSAALEIGITPSELCAIEKGQANPSFERIVRIQRTLKGPVLGWSGMHTDRTLLPAWIEVLDESGIPVLTDGTRALQLHDRVPSDAKCGTEAFGHRFWESLSKKEREIFTDFGNAAKHAGWTITEAYQSWLQQWRVLNESAMRDTSRAARADNRARSR